MHFITINTFAEFACFIAAAYFLWKDADKFWRSFIPYLLLTCMVEVGAIYLRHDLLLPNLQVYNAFIVVEWGFVSYAFYQFFKQYKLATKLMICWAVLFAVFYTTELYLNQAAGFVSMTAVLLSVVFVLASLLYYYLKLKDELYAPLLSLPSFWWVSGTLIFYFGSTACNLFFDLLVNYELAAFNYSVRYLIFNVLNVMLYGAWIIAFICRYRQRKLQH